MVATATESKVTNALSELVPGSGFERCSFTSSRRTSRMKSVTLPVSGRVGQVDGATFFFDSTSSPTAVSASCSSPSFERLPQNCPELPRMRALWVCVTLSILRRELVGASPVERSAGFVLRTSTTSLSLTTPWLARVRPSMSSCCDCVLFFPGGLKCSTCSLALIPTFFSTSALRYSIRMSALLRGTLTTSPARSTSTTFTTSGNEAASTLAIFVASVTSSSPALLVRPNAAAARLMVFFACCPGEEVGLTRGRSSSASDEDSAAISHSAVCVDDGKGELRGAGTSSSDEE
mmetsp:Transcript_69021/g.129661  ORF Transcript_69021/g.129661 Transcript_69021/m.129661 type:complete len:291 (+) Transcript_69021:2375-3247(+)